MFMNKQLNDTKYRNEKKNIKNETQLEHTKIKKNVYKITSIITI